MEGGTSLELVLSAAKTSIKTVFHFWRLSPKCHTKFVAAAAQLHSNLPPLTPAPPLSPGNLFSPASCPIHFVKLLPFKSETNDESKIYVKYVWQHFQKKAPAALPTFRLPALSLSVSFMVNKNCVVSLHKRLQISKLFDKFYCQNNFPQKFLMLLKFSFQESLFCVKLRIFVGRKL